MAETIEKGIISEIRVIFKKPIRAVGMVTILAVLLLVVIGCSNEPSSENATPVENGRESATKGTIVAVGDSLTAGLGLDESEAYPAILEKKLVSDGYPFKVINAGFSGETSSGTLSRINWVLNTLKPDIIILETGANDGLRGIDPNLLSNNLDQIISTIKSRDIEVILAGMKMFPNLGPAYAPAFSAVYPEIAKKHDIPLIPFFFGRRCRPNPIQPE